MAARPGGYDEEPIWSRGGAYDYRPRSPTGVPPQGAFYSPNPYPHTTMVHSSAKPLKDSDVYK